MQCNWCGKTVVLEQVAWFSRSKKGTMTKCLKCCEAGKTIPIKGEIKDGSGYNSHHSEQRSNTSGGCDGAISTLNRLLSDNNYQ